MNEIYLNMYRVAVTSGRLTLEFVPEPYQTAIAAELNPESEQETEEEAGK